MGQKYAAYNSTGAITAYYDSIDSPPPTGGTAIEITDAEWQACLAAPGWTVVNGTLTAPAAPTAAALLAAAQGAQITALSASYVSASSAPVSYTSKGGIAKTYQADSASVALLTSAAAVYQATGATPSGFYWVAADNTQVPFTLADLTGLGAVIAAQNWAAFQHYQTQKAAIAAATTVAAVEALS